MGFLKREVYTIRLVHFGLSKLLTWKFMVLVLVDDSSEMAN